MNAGLRPVLRRSDGGCFTLSLGGFGEHLLDFDWVQTAGAPLKSTAIIHATSTMTSSNTNVQQRINCVPTPRMLVCDIQSILPFLTLSDLHHACALNHTWNSTIVSSHAPVMSLDLLLRDPNEDMEAYATVSRGLDMITMHSEGDNEKEWLTLVGRSAIRHHITRIDHQPAEDDSRYTVDWIDSFPHLQALTLRVACLQPQGLAPPPPFPHRLRVLNLHMHPPSVTNSEPAELVWVPLLLLQMMTAISHLPELTHLTFYSDIPIGSVDWLQPLCAAPRLEYFDMDVESQHLSILGRICTLTEVGETVYLTQERLEALVPPGRTNRHLCKLPLDAVTEAMIEILSTRLPNLQRFAPSSIENPNLRDFSFLSTWCDLRTCRLHPLQYHVDAELLAVALSKLTVLESLEIWSINVTSAQLQRICHSNSKLDHLVLFSSDALDSLAFLQEATSISSLALSNCRKIPYSEHVHLRPLHRLERFVCGHCMTKPEQQPEGEGVSLAFGMIDEWRSFWPNICMNQWS